MTSRDFCFWLQGYFEVTTSAGGATPSLSPDQLTCVRQHLALVFQHEIDPAMGGPAHQAELNATHTPAPQKPGAPWGGYGPGTKLRC